MNYSDITATLYLGTDQISTSRTTQNVSNEIGGWSEGRKEFWFNVNFRTLLGDIYDKYDSFIISYVSSFYKNTDVLTNNPRLILQMGGLNWIHSSYNQASQSNFYWTSLPTLTASSGVNATGSYIVDVNSACYVFKKGSAVQPMYFRYIDERTNEVPSGIVTFPIIHMIFKIQPLK